ncbi:ESPR-type extended signal peptide-containing protein, partial [Haemophilus haemolyticus]|uniref:ESPR-type extended signal peptide-containing protein n=1 Tax=Haemophilus haemolyticus TaxID=726 RepID=UPI00062DC31F
MNHIYKVIWNTITQTWVAVSELSRAKGKTKSSKTLSAVVLAAVSAGAIVGGAEAAINYPQGTHTVNGMAIGTNSYANRNSVAYGEAAKANDGYSVAIGANAVTNRVGDDEVGVSPDRGMIAIGSNSVAKLEGATAIGSKAEAAGQQSTAVGNGAQAKGYNSSAFGEGAIAEKNYGVAVGKSANAKEQLGIAVGKNASAENYLSTAVGAKTQAKGESSIAIGSGDLNGGTDLDAPEGAKATGNASMAIGASAKATADNATALGKKANASGQNSIAVGAGAEITPLTAEQDKNKKNQNGNNGVAIGASSKATHYSTAVGSEAKATGKISSAFGDGAQALSEGSSAFGSHANVGDKATGGVALGHNANVTIAGGVALGQDSKTTNKDGSVRQGLNKDSYQIVRKSNDQTSENYKKFEDGGFSYSDKDTPDKVYAPVKLVDAPGALEAIKNTIRGSTGPVSIGNQDTTRQLINVAPGSADSDAVNVAQLKAVAGAIKHYDVVSPNGDITVTHPDPHDPNKTVWNLNLNHDRVKEITAWKLRDVDKIGNPKAGKTDALVKGDETVTFQDTDTIEVERVGTDGKTLKFNAKNMKYFSVKSSGGTNEDNKGATGDNAIAIGKDAASSANNAVVIGKSATALKNNERYDLNVGTATSNADSAVVIGNSATSKQARTVAIGNEAQTLHTSAIAIGDKAFSNGARGIAIGRNAQSKGNNSIALGSGDQNDGKKTTADKDYAVAIGSDAVANIANGIALGSESKTTATSASGQSGFDASQEAEGVRKNKYNGLTGKNLTSNLAGLSIGNDVKTRQINHLAAGTADDDAVNVAQLKSVNLAFKGDNGSGDVRLHDQRLSVVGATGSFITTKASDKKLEINTTKSNELQFTAGAANNITTPTGLTTDKAVANAINNSGWTLQAGDKTVGLINPGDKVNIASGNGITVTPTTETNGVSKITINATVAGIKAGRNVTVETTNGVSTINAIDTNTQASVSKLNNNSPITIDSTGTNSAGAKDYKLDVNVDDKTITKEGGVLKAVTGNLNVNGNGNLNTPQTGSALVNATTLTNVVNNTYWKAAAGGNHADGKTNLPADKVTASSTVTFNAGKNLTVDHSVANNFTFALNNTVDLTNAGSLTIGNTKVDNGGITITPAAGKPPVSLTANGLDNGGNKIVN